MVHRSITARAFVLGLVGAIGLITLTLAESGEGTVSLRWALGAMSGDSAPSAIQRDSQLAAGTKLKFLVEPTSPSSVYLILQDSDEAIHVLYRESSRVEPNGGDEPTYIPPGSQWFELDEKAGLETFFLLASVEPLTELEALLDRYEAGRASASDVIQEIRRLHKAHRNFARPVEKPVMIGGQTRGAPDSSTSAIDRLAVEASAEKFYAKTITIDH